MRLVTPTETLANALTIEGLIFVAFSFAYGLAASRPGGSHPFFAQGWFAWVVTLVIAYVAASAGADWWVIYHDHWPKDGLDTLRAFGLLVGIGVQPIFAGVISWQAKSG
jgi:hypothetical protein